MSENPDLNSEATATSQSYARHLTSHSYRMNEPKRPVMVPDTRAWVECPSCGKVYLVPRQRAQNTLCPCTMSPALSLNADLLDALDSHLPKPTVCLPMRGDPLKITGYNAPEDAEIAHKWLEGHQRADELIADPDTGMVISAVYHNPVRQHYEQQRAQAVEVLRFLATIRSDDEMDPWT